jgi:hypothetical protein
MHTCNPTFSGGRDQKDQRLGLAQAKSTRRYPKIIKAKKKKKKDVGVAQVQVVDYHKP